VSRPGAHVMDMLDAIRSHILALPDLAKFAVIIAAIVGVIKNKMA